MDVALFVQNIQVDWPLVRMPVSWSPIYKTPGNPYMNSVKVQSLLGVSEGVSLSVRCRGFCDS